MPQRFAIAGLGQRSGHFVEALLGGDHPDAELVALCDADREALAARVEVLGARAEGLTTHGPEDLESMIRDRKVDQVVVLTPDHTHDELICRTLEAGADAITEKPLTIDERRCQRIVDAVRRTGRRCRVTFNYRYAPWNTRVKELLVEGAIGQVVSMARRHTLGSDHGPFYFHRWHAQRERSGGLLVHKSTHFFDLANFFIASVPKRVFARGARNYFTPGRAAELGLDGRGARCGDCEVAERCPFFKDHRRQGEPTPVVEARGASSGYFRDLCVFRDEVDIPDTMHVMVEYENGALFNYQLVAFGAGASDEIIYGTHGLMHTTGGAIRVVPYYGEPYDVRPPKAPGAHGGADPIIFRDLFDDDVPADPLHRGADYRAGAWSALIGIAAMRSIDDGEAVEVASLVDGLAQPDHAPNAPIPAGFATDAMRDWVRAQGSGKPSGAANTFGADG